MALLRSIQEFLGLTEEAEAKHDDEKGDHDHARHAHARDREDAENGASDESRHRLALARIFEGILQKLELIDHQLQGITRVEAAVGGMNGMVQFVAKGGEKRDRELRAHITTELEKLGATLRMDAARQGAIDVFKTVLPSLDDLDHVLSQEDNKSIAMVRKKLKESFAKLGIEEIAIEPMKTRFDSELHDGEPYRGDEEAAKALEDGTIVVVERAGYKACDVLLRAAKVRVKG